MRSIKFTSRHPLTSLTEEEAKTRCSICTSKYAHTEHVHEILTERDILDRYEEGAVQSFKYVRVVSKELNELRQKRERIRDELGAVENEIDRKERDLTNAKRNLAFYTEAEPVLNAMVVISPDRARPDRVTPTKAT